MNAEFVAPPPQTSSFKLILTLGVAGFFSGIALVGIFLLTKPIIEQNKRMALQQAIFHVLPGCESFKTLELKNGKLSLVLNKNNKDKSEGIITEKIFAGFNHENRFIGFAIQGAESGFQDVILAIYGYDPEKRLIIGFEVLDSRETPGLGDKIIKDGKFLANFKALAVDPEILPAKPGEKEKNNQVETILGATISSKAVVRLLSNSIGKWRPLIDDYIQISGN